MFVVLADTRVHPLWQHPVADDGPAGERGGGGVVREVARVVVQAVRRAANHPVHRRALRLPLLVRRAGRHEHPGDARREACVAE